MQDSKDVQCPSAPIDHTLSTIQPAQPHPDPPTQQIIHDWRFFEDDRIRTEFPMNKPEHQGATILLVGANFGCSSGREKAVLLLVVE